MTRREQAGLATTGMWDRLFDEPVAEWRGVFLDEALEAESWLNLARRGGYPVPALHMRKPDERQLWFDSYQRTSRTRPASVGRCRAPGRLRAADAGRMLAPGQRAQSSRSRAGCRTRSQHGQALHKHDGDDVPADSTGSVCGEPHQAVGQVAQTYWGDTGLAMWISGEDEPRGAHLENLVLNDLLAWSDARADGSRVLYWRTDKGAEVDFVIERGERLLPVEVKSGRRVSYADTDSLRLFAEEYEGLVDGALVLYGGEDVFWISEGILALPWWRIL